MDLLTIRRLPVLGFAEPKLDYRMRISKALVKFVTEAVQKEHPGLKCGQRFAVEWALQQFLMERGLLKKYAAQLPQTVEMLMEPEASNGPICF